MKTALISAIAFASLTGMAAAQEAPILYGNYAANVRSHIDPGVSVDRATVTPRHAVSTVRRDGGARLEMPCGLGNYSANVTCDGIRSGR